MNLSTGSLKYWRKEQVIKIDPHGASGVIIFNRLTRTAYLYNGCLPWYNVVLTSRVHSNVKYGQQSTVTTEVSCNGGICVLNHCLSWSKFVNTHLSHSRQWFNIHVTMKIATDDYGEYD